MGVKTALKTPALLIASDWQTFGKVLAGDKPLYEGEQLTKEGKVAQDIYLT